MVKSVRKFVLPLALVALGLMSVAAAPSARAAATSNYVQNHFFDWFQRAQTFTAPTTIYVALATTTASAQACGTEVSGGAYVRVAVTSSLSNWAGTQGAGTTTASSNSSGSSGTTSNNNALTYPAPTANWGSVTTFCIFDSSTGGNLLYYAALTTPKTINSGDAAPSFAAGALTITLGKLFGHPVKMLAANDPVYFRKAG